MRLRWLLTACVPFCVQAADLTMEQIMAHPDWIARSPENAFIASDNRTVYFQRKLPEKELRQWWRISVNGGEAAALTTADSLQMENERAVTSADGRRVAYLNKGSVWLNDNGTLRNLIKGSDFSQVLTFVGNDKLALRAQNQVWTVSLKDGSWEMLVDVRVDDEPNDKLKDDFLSQQQRDLFEIVRKRQQRKEERKALDNDERATGLVAAKPFYVGKNREINSFSLSPNGRYLIVGAWETDRDGRADQMPHYVSDDGYVKIDKVRSKVGSDKPDNETFYWIDISQHTMIELDKKVLPGIDTDPLLALKIETAKAQNKEAPKAAVPRAVYCPQLLATGVDIKWNRRGDRAAFYLLSYDNKDRWLVQVRANKPAFETLHQLSDAAWVNDGDFNEMGWLADDESLFYTSEHTGFSQLYHVRNGAVTALTHGEFEIDNVKLSADNRWLYFRANKNHPGNHEVYRVAVRGGEPEAITTLGGENDFRLARDGKTLLILHSEMLQPLELYSQSATPGSKAKRLTFTVEPAFNRIKWHTPEVTAVPSKHGAKPIYARVYRNDSTQIGARKPAVMFVHGAGYLQNAHYGWSTYFREFMFHNLLLEQGYVVIDMDYRGSAGYGRDWRTAIYQRMGTPELEDYLDGIDYLVDNANVDRQRVGIYGGSYGGFMAFMALFKSDAFAAGAALRPVTDWAHYNHGYTSNILNTPDVDPQAYQRSSPINFAHNLKRPLLICTGMLDDNVFFQDSVRLVQRLIELKIPHFETAVYPIEPHGFKEPESWLDEYRRIYRLMEREVKNRQP